MAGLWAIASFALGALGAQAGSPTGTSAVDIRHQRYIGLDQLLKILDHSPRAYAVQNTNQIGRADLIVKMYPQKVAPIAHPWRGATGTSPLAAFPLNKAAARQIEAGQNHLDAGRLDPAKTAFDKALKIQPGAYPALLGQGQISLRSKRADLALGAFHQALVHNPDDPLTHRLLGDAAAARGLTDQARKHFVQALARRPRDPETLAGLTRLGLGVPVDLFHPRAATHRQGRLTNIYVDASVPASRVWMAWAAARAAWLGEPELRQRYGGTPKRPDWSTQQELFCLACLLGHYLQARKSDKTPALADLERLLKIQARQMLVEYVLYAIGTRLDPNAALMLSAEQRKRMEAFVDLFVVPAAG